MDDRRIEAFKNLAADGLIARQKRSIGRRMDLLDEFARMLQVNLDALVEQRVVAFTKFEVSIKRDGRVKVEALGGQSGQGDQEPEEEFGWDGPAFATEMMVFSASALGGLAWRAMLAIKGKEAFFDRKWMRLGKELMAADAALWTSLGWGPPPGLARAAEARELDAVASPAQSGRRLSL